MPLTAVDQDTTRGNDVASELEELTTAAFELASVAGRTGDIAERAQRLGDRLAQGRFHVSVLGEFKRGKSTLVNALLGDDVLPTGVLPLTAVATEISFGERRAVVVPLDGPNHEIAPDEIADFVTEECNPENERRVNHVELQLPAPLLEPGVVLVDTPGLGSIYSHNDEQARRALFDADGAILVLSADSPLSAQERELLGVLAERRKPTFFVLNKIDHLAQDEADQVRRFVNGAIAGELGRKERLWCVSARAALVARKLGHIPDRRESGEFAAFETAFGEFVGNDLVEARLATARRELAHLGRALDDAISLEEAALLLDSEELARRVVEFDASAADQRQAFEDDRTLLARDVETLMEDLAERLFDFARKAPADWTDRLQAVARATPLGRLEDELQRSLETAVQECFEEFRQAESDRVEKAWSALAQRFRAKTEARVNRIRATAADLFVISLPDVAVPEVSSEREQFFYLFLHVDPLGEEVLRVLRRVLPPALFRRRMLARASEQLAREFDKHAGRARWDLAQRLDSVRRQFEVAMSAELEGTVEAITAAARRTKDLQRLSEAERARQLGESGAAREAARHALAFAETGRIED
jgi:GTPase SAR1 family protein